MPASFPAASPNLPRQPARIFGPTVMEQLSPQLMNRLVFAVIMHGLNEAQTHLALTVLSDALLHPNGQIRELAVVALADLPVPAAKRVPPLTQALLDENSKVRRRAARALGDQGVLSHSALPELAAGLKDTDPSVRRDCAGTIGRIGSTAHLAAPGLVAMLGECEYRTRAVASVALKRIGRAAIPALLDAVRTGDAERRGRSAVLLAKIAPDDDRVKEALQSVLGDTDTAVRAMADEALQLVNTPAPVAA